MPEVNTAERGGDSEPAWYGEAGPGDVVEDRMIRNLLTPTGPKLMAPPLSTPKLLTRKSNIRVCGTVVVAALVCAFPLAQGIGAVSTNPAPAFQVNRAAKGDIMAAPRPTTVRKVPVQTIPNPARTIREQTDKRSIMDGCEPSFSPVTMPSMAHVAGRCVG